MPTFDLLTFQLHESTFDLELVGSCCTLELMAERKARVLDGKALAAETRAQVAAELKSLREKYHDDFQPGLTIVQVVSLQQQFTLINERCCIKAIHLLCSELVCSVVHVPSAEII